MLLAAETLVAQNLFFGVIALAMALSAVKVVTTHNVVHAALYLTVVLAGVAAQYVLLAAEFVASTQVLVYIGAIIILFLFGIMLTRARLGRADDLDNDQRPLALVVSLFLLGVVGWVLWDAFGDDRLDVTRVQRTGEVADAIFGPYLVPFEAVSVLLLAALVGAIVIARRD